MIYEINCYNLKARYRTRRKARLSVALQEKETKGIIRNNLTPSNEWKPSSTDKIKRIADYRTQKHLENQGKPKKRRRY